MGKKKEQCKLLCNKENSVIAEHMQANNHKGELLINSLFFVSISCGGKKGNSKEHAKHTYIAKV